MGLKFNPFGGGGIGSAFSEKEDDGRHSELSIALNGGTPWNQWKMKKKNSKLKKAQAAKDAANSPQAIQARIAMEQWQDFKTRYIPVENQFLKLVRKDDTHKAAARGVANAEVAQNFDNAAGGMTVQRVLHGDTVGGDVANLSQIDAAIARGQAGGATANAADRSTEDLHYAGLQKAVALGRNLANEADLGIHNAAQLGAADAESRAQAAAARATGTYGAAGTAVGALGQGLYEYRRNAARTPVTAKPVTAKP